MKYVIAGLKIYKVPHTRTQFVRGQDWFEFIADQERVKAEDVIVSASLSELADAKDWIFEQFESLDSRVHDLEIEAGFDQKWQNELD